MDVLKQIVPLPDENSRRFVAVLSEKAELGRLLNALGHMTAGLAASVADRSQLCLLEYRDAGGGLHPNVSHFPFIVLKAENSNQLRKLREQARLENIPCTDFTRSMTLGTSEEQLRATLQTPEAELEYLGVCLFGDSERVKALTKRFSLFR